MTFEEQIRVIELKELSREDERQVYTKLVCVYFENRNGDLHGSDSSYGDACNGSESSYGGVCNGIGWNHVANQKSLMSSDSEQKIEIKSSTPEKEPVQDFYEYQSKGDHKHEFTDKVSKNHFNCGLRSKQLEVRKAFSTPNFASSSLSGSSDPQSHQLFSSAPEMSTDHHSERLSIQGQ